MITFRVFVASVAVFLEDAFFLGEPEAPPAEAPALEATCATAVAPAVTTAMMLNF
jgi:hypothetical protein